MSLNLILTIFNREDPVILTIWNREDPVILTILNRDDPVIEADIEEKDRTLDRNSELPNLEETTKTIKKSQEWQGTWGRQNPSRNVESRRGFNSPY